MTAPLTEAARQLLIAVGTENAGAGVVLEHSDERAALISRRLIRRLEGGPRDPVRYVVTLAGSERASEPQ